VRLAAERVQALRPPSQAHQALKDALMTPAAQVPPATRRRPSRQPAAIDAAINAAGKEPAPFAAAGPRCPALDPPQCNTGARVS